MAIDTVAAFNDALARTRLLGPEQLSQLARVRLTDPRALARELIQRGYLTAYQVNHIFQGNAGELVLGPYVLLDRLGEGGMGQVYRARHQKLNRIVAIKVIRKDKVTDLKAVERFRREIKAISQLSHANVIKAFDADQVDDAYFLTMEYVEGIDLAKRVKDQGPLPVGAACEYMRQAALALQHVHECSLVHRDVKPSNLLLARTQRGGPLIKLLDLGLARLHWTAGEEAGTLTRVGVVVGTPEFMAPEQARNSHRADIRSDLYSLGCTFYYVLTGQPPISGETSTETLMKQCFEEPRPIEELRPDVPPRVRKILQKLLAKDAERRYQTPAKLVQALGRPGLLATGRTKRFTRMLGLGKAEAQVRPDAPERLQKVARRRRWLRLGLVGAGLALGLFLTVLANSLWDRGSATTRPSSSDERVLTRPTEPSLARAPLDFLDAKAIPADERFAWQPKELVAVLGGHRGRHWGNMNALAVSPDGQLIVTAGQDGFVNLLEAGTLKLRASLREEGNTGVAALAFSAEGSGLAVGYYDGSIALYALTDAKPAKQFVLHGPRRYAVNGLAFSPTAPVLASSAGDDVGLWDLARGDQAAAAFLHGHQSGVQALAFSHDGKLLASAGRDRSIRLWDIKGADGVARSVLPGHEFPVTALAFSLKGDRLVSTSSGRSVRISDVALGKPLGMEEIVQGNAFAAGALSRDGQLLACVAGGSPVHVWDLTGPAPRDRGAVSPLTQGTWQLAVGSSGRTLVTFGNQRLQTWDLSSGQARPLLAPAELPDMSAAAFSRDGKLLATGGRQGRIVLWDLGGPQPTRRTAWEAHSRNITALQFSPDAKLLASGANDARAALWDTTTGPQEIARLTEHSSGVSAVLFAPDGRTLFTASYDRSVRGYDLHGGKPRPRPDPLSAPDSIVALALDPAGRNLAAVVRDYGLRIWDVTGARGQFRADVRLLVGKAFYGDLAFAPLGKTLAVGTPAGSVRLFEVLEGQPAELAELALPQNRGVVHALAYSPGGRWLAVSYHNCLYLWDPATRNTIRGWEVPGPIEELVFSPDGRHLATVNANGTVYILRLGKPGS